MPPLPAISKKTDFLLTNICPNELFDMNSNKNRKYFIKGDGIGAKKEYSKNLHLENQLIA